MNKGKQKAITQRDLSALEDQELSLLMEDVLDLQESRRDSRASMSQIDLQCMTIRDLEQLLEAVIRECRKHVSEFTLGATCDDILVTIRKEKETEK